MLGNEKEETGNMPKSERETRSIGVNRLNVKSDIARYVAIVDQGQYPTYDPDNAG